MEAAPPKPNFNDRVNAVFGFLGDTRGGWNLSDQQTINPGRDADLDSSDEEEDAQQQEDGNARATNVAAGGSRRVPGGGLADEEEEEEEEAEEDEEDEEVPAQQQEEDLQASRAFCRAFDREAEEDEFDLMAAGTYHTEPAPDSRPARNLEVLDDNPFDRLCNLRKATGSPTQDAPSSSAQRMDVEAGPHHEPGGTEAQAASRRAQQGVTGGTRRGAEGRADASGKSSVRIKPGHGVWAPRHRRGDGDGADDGNSRQEGRQQQRSRQDPQPAGPSGGQQMQQQRMPQGRPRGRGWGGRGGRHVPDHVKNPDKWTCYVLDEPIMVGQGDKSERRGDEGGGAMRQALASAQAAAAAVPRAAEIQEAPPVERYITDFGVGIQFRPKGGKSKEGGSAARQAGHESAAGTSKSGCVVTVWEDGEEPSEAQAAAGSSVAVAMEVEGAGAQAAGGGAGVGEGAAGVAGKKRARQFRNWQGGD